MSRPAGAFTLWSWGLWSVTSCQGLCIRLQRCSIPWRRPFFQDARVTSMHALRVIKDKNVEFKMEIFIIFFLLLAGRVSRTCGDYVV